MAFALLVGHSGSARAATTTLKFATLLPQNSPWGRELKKWATLVSTDTGGDLEIDFQWNGQAGDEVLMVQKIRAGQLDGAVVSATGLAQTGVTDALLFQLPGVFADWTQLDAARAAVADDLEKDQALPQRFKDIMSARGAALQGRLEPLVRNLDAQAFDRMKATKTVYDLSEAEKREWKDVFDRVAIQLRGSVFTPAMFDRVVKAGRP